MTLAIELTGKVALVTGGSSGIGAATVRALHQAGASVFFTYWTHEERAKSLVAQLRDGAGYCQCDVSRHELLPSVIDKCVDRFGGLDILVNNAGIYEENSFEHTDYASWRQGWQHTFDVNLFAAAHLAFLAMEHMRKRRTSGRIVNVASRSAHRGELRFADYAASKAALVNFTKSVARSCAKDGITALAVAPGFIQTAMAAHDLATRAAEVEAEIPLGYVAQPEEIARIIAFAASSLATYANGATIDVNGASYVR